MSENLFKDFIQVDVGDHIEKKNDLSYLSWVYAWQELKLRCPDATYEVWKDEMNRPYIYDENLGYMCYTKITAGGETHEMWLPVMDNANKAMKNKPYEYSVRNRRTNTWEKRTVEAPTMFDINRTIMRCLAKNVAVGFGLGLYIYAGEDIPMQLDENGEVVETKEQKPNTAAKPTAAGSKTSKGAKDPKAESASPEQVKRFITAIRSNFASEDLNRIYTEIMRSLGLEDTKGMTVGMYEEAMAKVEALVMTKVESSVTSK